MSNEPPRDSGLKRRVAQLERKFENQPADFVDAVRTQLARVYGLEVSRRDVIATLTGAGFTGAALLALTPGQAAAAVVGNIGTNADPLDTVFTQTLDPGTSGTNATVAGGIVPDADGTRDLGATATRWANLYADAVTTGSIGNGGSPIEFTDTLLTPELQEPSPVGSSTPRLIPDSYDMNDGTKRALFSEDDNFGGQVFLSNNNGRHAHLATRESDSVTILSQSGSVFSTTEDNQGTTNVYWDSGNSRMEINNEVGVARQYVLWVMKVV